MTDGTAVRSQDLHPLLGQLGRNWGWVLALGILFLVLGVVGLGMLFGLTIASVLFFGVLLLIGGGAQIVETFKVRGWKGILWHILMAVLYIIGGIAVIADPVLASAVITLVLAAVLVAVGVARIVMALQLRGHRGWIWPLLGGIVSIVLGGMIYAEWPVSGLWVIGLFVAIEMLICGWTYVSIALAARAAAQT